MSYRKQREELKRKTAAATEQGTTPLDATPSADEPAAKRAAVDATPTNGGVDTPSRFVPMSTDEEKQLVAVVDNAKATESNGSSRSDPSPAKDAKPNDASLRQAEDPDYNVGALAMFGVRGLYINRQNPFKFEISRKANDKGQGKEAFPYFFNIYPQGNPRAWPQLKLDLNRSGCAFMLPLARISHLMFPPLGTLVKTGEAKLEKSDYHKMKFEMGVCSEPLFEEPGQSSNPHFVAALHHFEKLYQLPIVTLFEEKKFHIKNGHALPFEDLDPETDTQIIAERKVWKQGWTSSEDIAFAFSAEHKAIVESQRYYKYAAKLDDDDMKAYVYDTAPYAFRIEHGIQGVATPKLTEMTPLQQSTMKIGDATWMCVKASIGTKGVGGVKNRMTFELLGFVWAGNPDQIFVGRRNMTGDAVVQHCETARVGDAKAFYEAFRPEEEKAKRDTEALLALAERKKQLTYAAKQ